MSKYDSNLASEFYILASLYRLGINAFVTLGNKKSVDIIVESSAGKQVTIDVKGMKGKTSFPVDNVDFTNLKRNHFLIFVAFLDQMEDPSFYPEIYIIPQSKLEPLLYENPKRTRKTINLGTLRKKANSYKDNWGLLQ